MRKQTPIKRVLFARALRPVVLGLFVVLTLTTLFTLRTPVESSAATNNALNFQARLESSTGAIVPDGNYNVEFKLYNVGTGGSALWTETYQNSSSQGITVRNGYLTVNLGSLNAFPSTINWDQDLWLTMNIGGTSTGATPTYDGEMTPRLKLTGVPYAFRAGQLAQFNNATGFTSSLSLVQPTGGDQIFQIPDQGAAGTFSLLTTQAANNSFIQLQTGTPGSVQTGNFNINGTGIAGVLQGTTSVQTPLLDTASAGALDIGTTNATAINLNQNVTVATGKTLTVQGAALFKNSTDSTTGFQVQSSLSTTPILNVDTVGSRVGIGTASPQAPLHISLGGLTPVSSLLFSPQGVLISNSSSQTNLQLLNASNNASSKSALAAVRSRGTADAPTKVLQGDSVFSFQASGYDGSSRQNSGSIDFTVDGATSAGTVPMAIGFAVGTSTANRTTVLTIASSGAATFQNRSDTATAFQIQNTAGNSILTVDATATAGVVLGKASTITGQISFANAANANIATLKSGTTAASYTALLPSNVGAVGQCLAVIGVAGSTQTLGYSSCALATGGGYVTLQGATPGVADAGNFNITGTGIVSNFKVNPTIDSTSVLQVTNNAGNYLLNVNSSNGFVINNGTKNIGNELQNPSFESGGSITTTGEQGWSGPAQASIVNSSANANTGNYELQVTPNGTTLNVYGAQYLSVNTGDVIYAEGWVKNSAGANGSGGIFLEGYDKDKASVGTTSDAASLPGTSYVLRKVTYTVPSGVKFVRVGARVDSSATTGTYYFDDFYVRGSVAAPAVFKNSADSGTAFLIQSAGSAQTLFTADTANNVLRVGDSTGTDTSTTIFVLDSASANPTTNLASKNGGLFYRSDTNTLKAVIGGAVVDICTTAVTCSGYAASATSSIQLQPSSPGSAQTGNFNITGTGILSQLQSSDTSTPSSNSPGLVIRTGNATGTTSNSGDLTLDVGTATGTLGQIIVGHAGVTTLMPGMLDVQGDNALKLGKSNSFNGSILFRISVGSNTVTLKAAAADPASSIVLTLPTALGSAGYCLKDTGGGALGFSDCGVGATVTLQNVYDYSSPANILLSDAKDFTITAQDTGTDPNILFNLACTSTCGSNGRFAIQNGGVDTFVVKPNGGGIVLGVSTQVGSATTDGTQYNLQLDSSSTFADSGSCTATTNQGAMYYNTDSQSIRTCQDGGWSDVLTTRDLGLLMFGVVPDSGTSNQGDLPALVTSGVSGPCKVSWNSANSIHIEACVAYSGGRRVNVTSTNITITGMTTTNIWKNVCLTGTNNQPALSSVAASSETSSASGFFPDFNISAPILCLAQIKGSTSTANNIAQIYDVRTFSTTQKIPMLASTALSIGMLADVNPSTAVPSASGSRRMIGVVVATNGSTSSTSPNVILTTFGPAWVKATGGTAGDFVIQSSTNGYTQTNTTIPNNSFNYEVGITPTNFSSTCSAASNCSGSLFVNFQVR